MYLSVFKPRKLQGAVKTIENYLAQLRLHKMLRRS